MDHNKMSLPYPYIETFADCAVSFHILRFYRHFVKSRVVSKINMVYICLQYSICVYCSFNMIFFFIHFYSGLDKTAEFVLCLRPKCRWTRKGKVRGTSITRTTVPAVRSV